EIGSGTSSKELDNEIENLTFQPAETLKTNTPVMILGECENGNVQFDNNAKPEASDHSRTSRVQSTPVVTSTDPTSSAGKLPVQYSVDTGKLEREVLKKGDHNEGPVQHIAKLPSSQVGKSENAALKKANEDRPSLMKLRATAPSFEPANKTLSSPI